MKSPGSPRCLHLRGRQPCSPLLGTAADSPSWSGGCGMEPLPAALGLPPSKGGRWQSQNQPKCLKLPQKERLGGVGEPAGGSGWGCGVLERLWGAAVPGAGPGCARSSRDAPSAPGLWRAFLRDRASRCPARHCPGGLLPQHPRFLGPKLPEMGAGDALAASSDAAHGESKRPNRFKTQRNEKLNPRRASGIWCAGGNHPAAG